MRFFSLLFACAIGCGGSIAADRSDASIYSNEQEETPISDSIGPPTDLGPPPSCPLMSDPCFAQFAAELSIVASCMGHPDTCAASGNTDPSGCGVQRPAPGGGSTCSWSDGARQDNGSTSGDGFNAKGAACYKYGLVTGGGGATVTIWLPDGKTFVETIVSSSGGSITVKCPDGTTTRPFTNAEQAACRVGVTCCSTSMPPKCG